MKSEAQIRKVLKKLNSDLKNYAKTFGSESEIYINKREQIDALLQRNDFKSGEKKGISWEEKSVRKYKDNAGYTYDQIELSKENIKYLKERVKEHEDAQKRQKEYAKKKGKEFVEGKDVIDIANSQSTLGRRLQKITSDLKEGKSVADNYARDIKSELQVAADIKNGPLTTKEIAAKKAEVKAFNQQQALRELQARAAEAFDSTITEMIDYLYEDARKGNGEAQAIIHELGAHQQWSSDLLERARLAELGIADF